MLDTDEAKKLAFAGAQDGAKQLLTLSTTIVAITITFFKDFASGSGETSRYLMTIAWVLFLMSIIAGVGLLFTLTGELAGAERGHDPSVMGKSSRVQAGAQQLSFLAAILVTVLAGVWAVWDEAPGYGPTLSPCCTTTSVPPAVQSSSTVSPPPSTMAPSEQQLVPPIVSSSGPNPSANP